MNNREFFNVLIGNPPPEIELEIELKCREVQQLPDFVIKDYCCDLVKQIRLQDMLLMASLIKISEAETRNCLLYTSPSPRDLSTSRMPSSA
mgnify:CR=1 FL=1